MRCIYLVEIKTTLVALVLHVYTFFRALLLLSVSITNEDVNVCSPENYMNRGAV